MPDIVQARLALIGDNAPAPRENKAFTDRLIAKLRSFDKGDRAFQYILNDYLIRMKRLGFWEERDLFMVRNTDEKWQVAEWLPLIDIPSETDASR